jgi:hypothetical protein
MNKPAPKLDTPETAPRRKVGKPALPPGEKQVNAGIYAKQEDIDYLLTWNPWNTSYAFRDLVEHLRKIHPEGRYSTPRPDPSAKLKPGTKTMLKRQIAEQQKRIADLEKQLRAAREGQGKSE